MAQSTSVTSVISSLEPSTYGDAVTFTAKISSMGAAAPSGNVNFASDIAGPLGAATLSGSGGTVTQLTNGYGHTCALLASTEVVCWGVNFAGQLGIGVIGQDQHLPSAVRNIDNTGNLTGVAALSSTQYTTCALMIDGSVVCWGNNLSGEVGDGAFDQRALPVRVRNTDGTGYLTGVSAIISTMQTNCALLSNEEMVCWGAGTYGELGNGTYGAGLTQSLPAPVRNSTNTANISGVQAIGAGGFHVCALLSGGSMSCWGYNAFGQIGNAESGSTTPIPLPVSVRNTDDTADLTGVAAVRGGAYHTCALLPDSTALCWGLNANGQLGTAATPIPANSLPAFVLDSSGTGNLTGIRTLSAGYSHTCAVLTSGAALCWGGNSNGQLGDGTAASSPLPVAVRNSDNTADLAGAEAIAIRYNHSCALAADQTATCWGSNDFGQLGTGDTIDRNTATPVNGLLFATATVTTTTTQLAAGPHTITASFEGDVNHLPSSGTFAQTVLAAPTASVIAMSTASSRYGLPVTVTVTVTSNNVAAGLPVGQVYLLDGADTIGPIDVNASGEASFTSTEFAVGTHNIVAIFLPSSTNFASSFPLTTGDVTISKAVTAVSLAPVASPVLAGQSVTLTAQIVVTDGAGTPAGAINFFDGATPIATATPDSSGQASTSLTFPAGPHGITAVYNEDATFLGSSSASVSFAVLQATTTLLTVSPGPLIDLGQPLILVVSVTSPSGTPDGTVTFFREDVVIGTSALGGGTATLTTNALSAGAHSLSARYEGTADYIGSVSTPVQQTIRLACTDAFALAPLLSERTGTVFGDSASATTEGGEPAPAGEPASHSVWCAWTPSTSGPVVFDTTGSAFDTVLGVYTGTSFQVLTPVAENKDLSGSIRHSRVRFDAVAGTTYRIMIDGTAGAAGSYLLNWSQEPTAPTLVSSTLPTSRSVVTGTMATAFATLINAGSEAASQCTISLPPGFPGLFIFQTTDAATNLPVGSLNVPADIPAGGSQPFVFGVTPTIDLAAAEIPLVFTCANAGPTRVISGLNTLILSAEPAPAADIIAISTTLSQDGIVRVPPAGTQMFVGAAINIGPGVSLSAEIDDNGADLPLTATLCQSDPATALCLGGTTPTAKTPITIGANQIVTLTAFVSAGAETVPFDPAASRLNLRFITPDGIVRGGSSVAVMTTGGADLRASAE